MNNDTQDNSDVRDVYRQDIAYCREKLDGDDSQFWRRAYVRSVFAFFEGFGNTLRDGLMNNLLSQSATADVFPKLLFLHDMGYRLDGDTGKIKEEAQKIPFLSHMAFTLRTYAEWAGLDVTFFGYNGWKEMRNAAAIRDRLTHPKKENDMAVSNADLETIYAALGWYIDIINSVVTQVQSRRQCDADSDLKGQIRADQAAAPRST